MTITGNSFENAVNGVHYTSELVIDTGAGTITLAPDSITDTELVVTVPALASGRYETYVVKNEMRGKLVAITVVPEVTIDSATVRGNIVTVRGSGLDESYNELPGVTVTHEGNALETSTIS